MTQPTEYPRYADLHAENAALRDLIASAVDALDVPAPADLTERGTEIHLRALRERAGSVRIALRGIDTATVNPADRAAWLREQVAARPLDYEPFQHRPLPELAETVQAEEQPADTTPTGVTVRRVDGCWWTWECDHHGRAPSTYPTESGASRHAMAHAATHSAPADQSAPTAAELVARAETVRDQLAAARLPQAAVWEVTHPSDDMLAAYAERHESLVMLSGRVESAADVTAWATAWRVPVAFDPSPTYPTARTTIDGITVEVWARANGGAR